MKIPEKHPDIIYYGSKSHQEVRLENQIFTIFVDITPSLAMNYCGDFWKFGKKSEICVSAALKFRFLEIFQKILFEQFIWVISSLLEQEWGQSDQYGSQ